MRDLIEALCSDRCLGRAPGTPGGLAARAIVAEALRAATGREPILQPVPGVGGGGAANVVVLLPGARSGSGTVSGSESGSWTGTGTDADQERWVLVGAHYDHLGRRGADVYRGADDNAAAVAILVDVARALARATQAPAAPGGRGRARGVILAAFDSEEPPHFLTGSMGSEAFARAPVVPLDRIDLMVCMDLVGHALGPEGLPDEVRRTVMALGAERSAGTAAHVDRLARTVPGVVLRRADAETIPPLSDYHAFWKRGVPFVFLSCGHWRHYHTPEDTAEKLDYPKMAALARWLERFVRETCERPEPRFAFLGAGGGPGNLSTGVRDDASTLRSVLDVCAALTPVLPIEAAELRAAAEELLRACAPDGRLQDLRHLELQLLVGRLEAGLA